MEENLLLVCFNAFLAVVLLLSILAGVIRLLMWLLPEPEPPQTDAAVVSAIASVAASTVPGGRITRIQETTR
ncbi:MAG: hypothetical protein WD294_09190 [Phycisphaeraceae bacterium]